jgi:YihY family inner membrane protein
VTKAAQTALNEVWEVPKMARPNFLKALLRSLLLLLVFAVGIISTTLLTGFGSSGGAVGAGERIAAIAASLVVNVGLFAFAFRVLTARDVAWRDLFPGAVVAAVAWQLLQALGSYYVSHSLEGASDTYGLFAVVIGLLSWLYLEARVVLYAAEVNVVRAARLWPRSLAEPKLTPADKRSYRAYAQVEERRPEVDVDVDFATVRGRADDRAPRDT